MTDKVVAIFVFGMCFGGILMIIAEAVDNTRERRKLMSLRTGNWKRYPYRSVYLDNEVQLQTLEEVCEKIFDEDFLTEVLLFDYVANTVVFPESCTTIILQALYNTSGNGLQIYELTRKIVNS